MPDGKGLIYGNSGGTLKYWNIRIPAWTVDEEYGAADDRKCNKSLTFIGHSVCFSLLFYR
jgi:hypothetical protein